MFSPHPNVVNFFAQSKTWQEFGTWSGRIGSYKGLVKTKKKGSLKELAKLITGNSKDWKVFGLPKKSVAKDTVVNIAPLLYISEENLRVKVVRLTTSFNSTFPGTGAEITSALGSNQANHLGSVNSSNASDVDEINSYFKGEPYKFCDCNLAIRIIYSKACLDTVGKDIFKAVCAKQPENSPKDYFNGSLFGVGSVPVDQYSVGSLKDVKNGDWIAFQNYDDYLNKMRNLYIDTKKKEGITITSVPAEGEGAWQQENALKVGANKFWGFPLGIQSEQQWLSKLQNAYNKPYGDAEGKQRTDKVPGFQNYVVFIGVVDVILAAFRYRAFQQTFCEPEI